MNNDYEVLDSGVFRNGGDYSRDDGPDMIGTQGYEVYFIYSDFYEITMDGLVKHNCNEIE